MERGQSRSPCDVFLTICRVNHVGVDEMPCGSTLQLYTCRFDELVNLAELQVFEVAGAVSKAFPDLVGDSV